MNLKIGVSRKQSLPNFPKNKHFLPPDTHTYVCVTGGKKCSFFGKSGVFCFLETPALRFALLPYYPMNQNGNPRNNLTLWCNTWNRFLFISVVSQVFMGWISTSLKKGFCNINLVKELNSLLRVLSTQVEGSKRLEKLFWHGFGRNRFWWFLLFETQMCSRWLQ